MANNISGFGSIVSLIASNTYPTGIVITQFSDDADAFDMASIKIGDVAMGVNGDLINWTPAVAKPFTLSVIPGSDDDVNLSILASANQAVQGQSSANDAITITVAYPNGNIITFSNGVITDAPFGNSLGGNGRLKTKTFGFMFQAVNGNI